ncbi:bifunctional phosphoribosylaminoimidazolecarboxamide formyltransferase/IMP cyclohydrolase [Ilumatobacter sp.]|uniref:bifunctional phosphoribosylaminoimidazolecarboxamide formyltransferase/IMP cyclohydrolase n=1 Tax=Ilumatobacter sp. TaxID=1967498 RepID=UPI003AF9B953
MPTALLSVYDKTGIAEFASALHELGWNLVSSGGTARAVSEAGVPVTDVADLTGVPAILDHRVVTLHPKVHGGLLADPTDARHRADMEEYGIAPISLVVSNLYPFGSDATFEHGSGSPVELIDIGGPAMVRASAKNHEHVAIVVDPADYDVVLAEIAEHGAVRPEERRRLARDAFAHTAAYDAAIVTWFDASEADPDPLPRSLHVALERAEVLRYGENPHQQGARYRFHGDSSWWDTMTQHGGKALSYLNLYDTEAAWRLVHRFDEPACVVVKHANPCGVAIGADIADAYVKANACDPVSAFGGIVAVNRPVTAPMAEAVSAVFTEVVVAPGYDAAALDLLLAKKNMRVVTADAPGEWRFDLKPLDGGFIVQQPDGVTIDRDAWDVVTDARPSDAQWGDLEFAWQVCAAVTSNAIVYAKDLQAFGVGAGQQNRLDSARIAAERSAGRAAGGVCASDAFFPFRDGLDATASAGIAAVIQPGGSVRDDEVIAAANEHGIAMVFTGERHFRH